MLLLPLLSYSTLKKLKKNESVYSTCPRSKLDFQTKGRKDGRKERRKESQFAVGHKHCLLLSLLG